VGASVDFLLVMPTYEYRCRDCGHTFEVVQKMTDEALTVCPDCGGELRKVFAVPAIAFKGSGFYATDHGKKAKRPSETSEKSEPKDTKKESASGDGTAAQTPAKQKDSTASGTKKERSGS
jgi:putative FmdB family regulatory protein